VFCSRSAERGGTVGRDTALQPGRSWIQFPTRLLGGFLIDFIFSATLLPGGRLGIFKGGGGVECVGLTTLPFLYAYCPEILKV
jgi:hypothetical protein